MIFSNKCPKMEADSIHLSDLPWFISREIATRWLPSPAIRDVHKSFLRAIDNLVHIMADFVPTPSQVNAMQCFGDAAAVSDFFGKPPPRKITMDKRMYMPCKPIRVHDMVVIRVGNKSIFRRFNRCYFGLRLPAKMGICESCIPEVECTFGILPKDTYTGPSNYMYCRLCKWAHGSLWLMPDAHDTHQARCILYPNFLNAENIDSIHSQEPSTKAIHIPIQYNTYTTETHFWLGNNEVYFPSLGSDYSIAGKKLICINHFSESYGIVRSIFMRLRTMDKIEQKVELDDIDFAPLSEESQLYVIHFFKLMSNIINARWFPLIWKFVFESTRVEAIRIIIENQSLYCVNLLSFCCELSEYINCTC